MHKRPLKISPSILSADFARLAEQVAQLEAAGCDWIHVDVMDGVFVPNITIGQPVVRALRKVTQLPLDVHLMIEAPERHIDSFAEAGADVITVHSEACTHLHRTVQRIRGLGKKAGVALNPATPIEQVRWVLEEVDLVLVMSVNPGFGGQKFIDSALVRLRELTELTAQLGVDLDVQVDGGVVLENAGKIVAAGANVLVSGTGILNTADWKQTVTSIREKAAI